MSIKSKILKFGLGIIGLNTFTACYGPAMPPPEVTRLSLSGKVVNEAGLPGPGIRISRRGECYAETDGDGLFEFPVYRLEGERIDTLHFTFYDPDGEAGDSYRDKVVVADFTRSLDCRINEVVMEEDK